MEFKAVSVEPRSIVYLLGCIANCSLTVHNSSVITSAKNSLKFNDNVHLVLYHSKLCDDNHTSMENSFAIHI